MTKISQWVTTMASKTPGSTVSLVGQGSFLDKPSLHMVGYMGKNAHSINAPHNGWCPVCKNKGQTQALKTYRINFTQSIFLCSNPQCIYPLGYTPLDNIIANTADLKKNSSPTKQKKRNISDLSPTPIPCEKRPKINLPIFGDSHTFQTDLCKSVPGFPTLGCETSSPTRLQHGQKEGTDSQMQNVSGPTNSFISSAWDKFSFSILPTGSPSRSPGQPDGLPAVQDGHQEVLQNGDLEVMDTLNNGSLSPLLPETGLMASKVEKVTEMTQSLNEELILNGLSFSSDHIPSYVSLPTPLLQNSQQECQMKKNSSKEMSVTPSNIDTMSALPQSCEFITNNLCLMEPPILQPEQPKEQMENMDDLTEEGDAETSSCNKEASLLIQENHIEMHENKVSPRLQHERSDQQINLSSLLEISPPTCPEAAMQENSFGSADLSESLQLKQESCEMTASSQSEEDVLQECPAEGRSVTDLWKPMSSPPCLVVEDSGKRSQCTLTSCDLEECQPENLSKDNSDTPMNLTSLVPDGSMVNTEDPTMPIPNLSLLQDLVQNCQKTNSEEHNPSNLSQDVLLESQVEEKTVRNTCDSPATSVPSVKDPACVGAAVVSSPGNQLFKTFDMTYANQKIDMSTPTDSLQGNQPVCHIRDGSLEKVCEPPGTSYSTRDNCNAPRDTKSINKMSLPGPQILLQDCLKCHCGMSKPSQSLNTQSLDKNCTSEVGSSLGGVREITDVEKAAAHINDKSLNEMPLSGLQILLQDCLKCHCGTNMPSQSLSCTQTLDKNSASEVESCQGEETAIAGCEKLSAQSDSPKDSDKVDTVENTAAIPPIECESTLSKQKKKCYEGTILPDLLLDIQPEHRMEEPLSAAPSPACDATVSMTLPSDAEVTKQDVWQNGQVKECDNVMEAEAMEILSDNIQDGSKLSNTLETSLNSEGLPDGSQDTEAENEAPAQVKASSAKKVKPAARRLQWKNKHSLCWLDCILSVLVQSETLIHFVAKGHHVIKESIIHNLLTRYGDATEMFIKSFKKRITDKRPKYEKCLNEVRMDIFQKLVPILKCKLGKRDSPSFAFPLLLRQDPETERLFIHSFLWKFKCEACGYNYQQRNQNTLTTFTKVLPEWHPLNAVHVGPCNQCRNTKQKRSMVLEKLNPIFMVHFVEGLPSSDLNKYSFQFRGDSYDVKAVIKYKNKHFCTWISVNDGTWLESDDLRGLFCRRQQKFRVRAEDIHIVIWERSNGKTFEEDVQLGSAEQYSEFISTNVFMASEDQNISSVAAAELSQEIAPTVQSVALNTSNPLEGMEDYADDDIITLTLVEIPLDENGHPIETQKIPLDANCHPAETPKELQPTDICTPLKESNQEEGTHTADLEMLTNPQSESQEDCMLTSPISSVSNAETVPLRDCSVLRSPLKQSPLKPAGEAIATSTSTQQPYNIKKSVVGNWMTRLINKDDSILNANPLANKILTLKTCPPLKLIDSSGTPKKAQNFNSFQGRSVSKTSVSASDILSSITGSQSSFTVPIEKATPTASGFRKPRSNGLDYGKLLSKEGHSSNEGKIHKLRLKLLKKLKAKKNELAALEKLAKIQQSSLVGAQAQGGFNRKEHLRCLLQELQEQMDNADNESICTMSSSTSICSSPGDAEFFAEIFSPSPVNNQPNDSSYLEMLADGCGLAAAAKLQHSNDHQGGADVLQSTSGSSNYCPTTSTLNNFTGDESLNLMSNSTVAILNEDNDYFDFDDYF